LDELLYGHWAMLPRNRSLLPLSAAYPKLSYRTGLSSFHENVYNQAGQRGRKAILAEGAAKLIPKSSKSKRRAHHSFQKIQLSAKRTEAGS
jgi:hypothetical protein